MKAKREITVLTYGTYDVLHRGHLRLLKRAKDLGTKLIVGLSTDEFNRTKGKSSFFRYDDRKLILKNLRHVDHVIPERDWEQKSRDVIRYKVDVFVMGDDWKGRFDHLKEYCEVVYLPRTRGVSTTLLKRKMAAL